jgi:N-formylglutamate amidohydrolase
MEEAFRAQGWWVERDRPYAGTFVPTVYYGCDERVRSVMVEVRRGLYMDEASGTRLSAFTEVGEAVTRAVAAALREVAAAPG